MAAMQFATTDLCDAHGDLVHVVHPGYLDLGGVSTFAGPIATLRVHEDNARVRARLETPGGGRVLVVDGGASMRCALVGGNLATLAADHGWAGIVVNGCVRDRRELRAASVGIRALATHPRKSGKTGAGEEEIAVTFGGVTFTPGHWLYADEDGIIVAPRALV
jgi:regulator of ribonuclease activity A